MLQPDCEKKYKAWVVTLIEEAIKDPTKRIDIANEIYDEVLQLGYDYGCRRSSLGELIMWFCNNILAVVLAVILCYFGHPVVGVIVALLIWQVPDKRKDDIVEDVEYEVHDADD